MKIIQRQYSEGEWHDIRVDNNFTKADFVLVFGERELIEKNEQYDNIKNMFPNADIISCSTAGEIIDCKILEGSLSLTAIEFDSSHVEAYQETIDPNERPEDIGKRLGERFTKDGLRHVMVFMDVLIIGCENIISSLQNSIPEGVAITGGLAADGDRLEKSFVGLNGETDQNKAVAIGFYGDSLTISHGSKGGWDPFGVMRLITKAKDNTIYELDHKPILDIYKEYLGDLAKDLPMSGLMFPLNISDPDTGTTYVRTLLSIDEKDKSIRYDGNVPEGLYAQLMKANINRLIEGAEDATKMSLELQPDNRAQLAIIIDCFGRKYVFKQRAYEEIDRTCSILGKQCATIGFYCYGEITPDSARSYKCDLQNQTMTITTVSEKDS